MAYAYKAAYELFKNYKMDNPNSLEDKKRLYLVSLSEMSTFDGGINSGDVFGVLSQLETNYYPKEYDYYKLRKKIMYLPRRWIKILIKG